MADVRDAQATEAHRSEGGLARRLLRDRSGCVAETHRLQAGERQRPPARSAERLTEDGENGVMAPLFAPAPPPGLGRRGFVCG